MTKDIKVTAITAMAQNGVIGKDNNLPWHIPDDLRHFKARTMGKPVIMGRKTFQSILAYLGKPMPKRESIVVSRGRFDYEGVRVFGDIEAAIAYAKKRAAEQGLDEIIIGGGAQIYKLAMPYTTNMSLTVVHQDYEGDAYFDAYKPDEWREINREDHRAHNPAFSFLELEKK